MALKVSKETGSIQWQSVLTTNLFLILGSIDITTQGQWWGDMLNGEGSMIHASGVSYEGMWINGRPEGIVE